MSALSYIIKTSFKNFLKQQLKKPVLLIVYAALIGLVIFSASTGGSAMGAFDAQSGVWKSLALAYFAIQTYIVLKAALTKGTTVFGLEDVQIMFCAPVKLQSVLLYGVVRQMARSLLVPLFVIFQIANLRNLLGMQVREIAALIFAMFLLAFVAQVIALCVYALLAQNTAARKAVTRALNVLAVAFVAVGLMQLSGGGGIDALFSFYADGAWNYVPLFGWLRGALVAAEGGDTLICVILFIASLLTALPLLLAVWVKQPDFYEDVLDSTQQKHELAQLAKSGKKGEVGVLQRKVRVGRKGIGRGFGASAFFHKQLLEQRRSGVMFFDMWTLVNVLIVTAMCFFLGQKRISAGMDFMVYTALATIVYCQWIFYCTTGQFAVEQRRQFIFLAPCRARGKIVACNMLGALKCAADAFLAFLIAGAVSGFTLVHAPFAGLLCGVLSLLFTGAQLIAELLIGNRHSKLLGMMMFIFTTALLLIPAVVLFIIGISSVGGIIPAYLFATAYGALAVFLLYMPLGEILHNMNVE